MDNKQCLESRLKKLKYQVDANILNNISSLKTIFQTQNKPIINVKMKR
jgi:hypothetical protein